jgi:prevent-host-death family protein
VETVTIHAAKTHLSQLLARVEAGEEIVLARGSAPIARLVPYTPPVARRQFGALRGQVQVDAAFFEPLPEEVLKDWGL